MTTEILPRSAWKARDARPGAARAKPEIIKGTVFHCIGDKASRAPGDARMRQIQNWHKDHNGWSDIAYNFSIDLDGKIWEGRGWAMSSAAEGAWAVPNGDRSLIPDGVKSYVKGGVLKVKHNPNWVSVLLQINTRDAITAEMQKSMRGFVELQRQRYPHATEIQGHRTLLGVLKSCPGDPAMAVIERMWEEDKRSFEAAQAPPASPWWESNDDYKLAVSVGITNGNRPEEFCTRAEAATMVARALKLGDENG